MNQPLALTDECRHENTRGTPLSTTVSPNRVFTLVSRTRVTQFRVAGDLTAIQAFGPSPDNRPHRDLEHHQEAIRGKQDLTQTDICSEIYPRAEEATMILPTQEPQKHWESWRSATRQIRALIAKEVPRVANPHASPTFYLHVTPASPGLTQTTSDQGM